MYKCMYHPSDSLGCVCFVVGAAVVLHRSSSKRKGRSLIEQPLLWVSVQTKLMKITRWLKPTKEVTCNGTVPARYLALPGAFTPGHQGTDTCSEPVAEKTVQCKTPPPSFLSSSLLWWLSQSVTHTHPQPTHTKFYFLLKLSALASQIAGIIGIHHSAQLVKCVLVHAHFHLEMLSWEGVLLFLHNQYRISSLRNSIELGAAQKPWVSKCNLKDYI